MSLQDIRKFFGKRDPSETVEERTFCEMWLDERDRSVAFMGMAIGAVYHALSLVTDQFMILQADYRWFMAKLHLAYLFLVAVYFMIRRFSSPAVRAFAMLAQVISVYGYVDIFVDQSTISPSLDIPLIKAWSAYMAMSIFLIQLCPFHNFVVGVYSAIFIGLAWFAWSNVPGADAMVGISIIAFVAASLFQRSNVRRSMREAKREFATRRQLEMAQKLAFEQQLSLAREIQDSLAPPAQFNGPGLRVRFLQKKHEYVGGDWMAFRHDDDGRVVIVVADASGKGVQAALVVHAVQALWAEAMAYGKFRPDVWLGRVNDALFRMGHRSAHAMTMGILVIERDTIEYWSAGHLPAFTIIDGDAPCIEVCAARGPMLGIGVDAVFACVRRKLRNTPLSVFVASDGVFGRGSTQSPRHVRQLYESLRLGVDNLSQISPEIEDDRTLVWVELDPQALGGELAS